MVINESINDPALLKVIRWEIVDRSSNRAEWFALCHRREHAERIVDAVNARQQTAAKDAELKACWNQLCEIGFMFDVVTPENNLRLAEIVKHKKEDAERERDSLREALKPISNTVAYLRKAYSAGADAEVVHAITDLQRYCTTVDAALKAGKGDEDGLRH